MDSKTVQLELERLISTYSGVQLNFIVADQQEQIYGQENSAERIGKIQGAYHPASHRAIFISSNLDNKKALQRTFRHEIIGHHGLNTFTAQEKRSLLNKIIDSRNEPSLSQHWQFVKNTYPDYSDSKQAEEVFAAATENRNKESIATEKVVNQLIQANKKLDLKDIHQIINFLDQGFKDKTRQQQIIPKTDNDQFSLKGENTMIDNKDTEEELKNKLQSTSENTANENNDISAQSIDEKKKRKLNPLIEKSYTIASKGNGKSDYYFKESDKIAFKDQGKSITTENSSKKIAASIIEVADSKGWDKIQVKGKDNFKKEIWLEAQIKGINVTGYTPNEKDLADLKERMEKQNAVLEENNKATDNTINTVIKNNDYKQTEKSETDIKKEELTQAYKTLSRHIAIQQHPELKELYGLEKAATELAEQRIGNQESRTKYVDSIRDRSLSELAKGNQLPKTPSNQAPTKTIEAEAER